MARRTFEPIGGGADDDGAPDEREEYDVLDLRARALERDVAEAGEDDAVTAHRRKTLEAWRNRTSDAVLPDDDDE